MTKRVRKPKPDPEPPRKGFLTREDFNEEEFQVMRERLTIANPEKERVKKPSAKRPK